MNKGILYAIGAYFLWGLFPIYWKLIHNIPALEIIAHRITWAFLFALLIIWIKKDWQNFKPALKNRKILLTYLIAGVLLFINWLVYVWAVNADFIVDASLGYFINPLVNVILGVIFLRERLRLWQWIPVGIAALGVLYLTISYGALPWIGLTLAFSFGTYGLLKKTAALNSIHGFTLETGVLFLPALLYLLALEYTGQGAIFHVPAYQTILLILTGVVTGLPLLLFGAAARLVPLSTMGFIQYIAPTLQFLIGVLVYGEAFTHDRLIGFGIIWLALAIFSIDGFRVRRKNHLPAPAI
ncbi:MAG TPA: EamA family transporter RarD [Chloroflexi bacterium]|nr:EamA family transporter RarD [Chloroflexota bacterium]HBY07598.1 EamA family transporter RarD [Chloroflexota bacterium]